MARLTDGQIAALADCGLVIGPDGVMRGQVSLNEAKSIMADPAGYAAELSDEIGQPVAYRCEDGCRVIFMVGLTRDPQVMG